MTHRDHSVSLRTILALSGLALAMGCLFWLTQMRRAPERLAQQPTRGNGVAETDKGTHSDRPAVKSYRSIECNDGVHLLLEQEQLPIYLRSGELEIPAPASLFSFYTKLITNGDAHLLDRVHSLSASEALKREDIVIVTNLPNLKHISLGAADQQQPLTLSAAQSLHGCKNLQTVEIDERLLTAEVLKTILDHSRIDTLVIHSSREFDPEPVRSIVEQTRPDLFLRMAPENMIYRHFYDDLLAAPDEPRLLPSPAIQMLRPPTDSDCLTMSELRELRSVYASYTYSGSESYYPTTDVGLRHLGSLPVLEALELPGAKGVTDKGLRYLEKCPRLRFVDVRNTGVTEAGATQLQRALPDCEIYYGEFNASENE